MQVGSRHHTICTAALNLPPRNKPSSFAVHSNKEKRAVMQPERGLQARSCDKIRIFFHSPSAESNSREKRQQVKRRDKIHGAALPLYVFLGLEFLPVPSSPLEGWQLLLPRSGDAEEPLERESPADSLETELGLSSASDVTGYGAAAATAASLLPGLL
ncbi:hypothetical protein NDU88_007233 [Pleurodeles waltl]|uniref:Uncharacterized protein n=1 Tax=Pleurodeles waltl TaxID=8319 RepID=A0AAV7U0U2_PLEWA|nr:hypothetical protein NDU88_007233 [Pleurodeles waltl]